MSTISIYHNTRCSKSNEVVKLLEEQKLSTEIKLYLLDPLTDDEIKSMLKGYVGELKELIRVKDAKKLGVIFPVEYSFEEVFTLLKNTPAIMERPVVGKDGKFIVARPADKAQIIL